MVEEGLHPKTISGAILQTMQLDNGMVSRVDQATVSKGWECPPKRSLTPPRKSLDR